MVKRSSMVRIGLALALALVLLVVMAQSAFAKISWCDEDLATMAPIAKARASDVAIGIQDGDAKWIGGHVVPQDDHAVPTSTENGLNPGNKANAGF